MAAREHKVSRRALLGAAVLSIAEGPLILSLPALDLHSGPKDALPLARHAELVSASSPPPPGRMTSWTLKRVQGDGKWQTALARFRRAEGALMAAEGAPDHLFDARNDTLHAALRRLLRTPAPALPILAVRIELVVDHEVATLTGE